MYESSSGKPPTPNTVILTGRDVADAARLLSMLIDHGAEPMGAPVRVDRRLESGRRAKSDIESTALVSLARKELEGRKARLRYFSKSMFGEPAWDMLLVLYVTDVVGPKQTVGRITELSSAPSTSALRWLGYLERDKLVVREPHPTDRRVTFIELTDRGRTAIKDYLLFISRE
jgi:DNA-binding MarR family transcriptional regulator